MEGNHGVQPKTPNNDRIVLCMKWGTKYGPEYVNRLYAMVKRHLTGAFQFVCLTDDHSGIHSDIACFPIPALALDANLPERGWKKLTTFKANLCNLKGTALFLDLDVVITDNIDMLFEYPGEFLIIHDWKRPWRITGNSSVYRFNIGAHADVLTEFNLNQATIFRNFRNEQAFLSHFLHQQNKLSYWPSSWCCSYKYHCIPKWPSNYWREPLIPDGVKIIVFHGEVNPPDALEGRRNRTLRFMRRARWISDYWRE